MEEERKVESLLREPLEGKGYELASVHYLSTKEGMKLEVVVDRVEPIGLEDIVALSGLISEILDKEAPWARRSRSPWRSFPSTWGNT